ncbi:ABC transporter, permease domain protein [Burkholderia mallei]|nr:ABC transporter, permease domain protein [Burkholderia mallei]
MTAIGTHDAARAVSRSSFKRLKLRDRSAHAFDEAQNDRRSTRARRPSDVAPRGAPRLRAPRRRARCRHQFFIDAADNPRRRKRLHRIAHAHDASLEGRRRPRPPRRRGRPARAPRRPPGSPPRNGRSRSRCARS